MKYIVLLFITGCVFVLVSFGHFLLVPPGLVNDAVLFDVKKGEPFGAISSRLEKTGLISSALLLKILGRITDQTKKIQAGEYQINRGMTPVQILEVLSSGKSVAYSVTIPEGINMYTIGEIFEAKGLGSKKSFLTLVHNQKFIRDTLGEAQPSLEGYLFPETYSYTKSDNHESLVRLMVARFLKTYEELKKYNRAQFSRHEWVILASIVEKETGYKKERKYISSVFHNRLKKNMRLQTDPTVLYGILDKTKKEKKNITKKDLLRKNKYNTYTFKGLPYGPISNPGKEALLAAVLPARTNYLYFVSRNDGTSYFSSNLRQHNRAVREFQMNRAARKGKSWRDLRNNQPEGN